jgi:cobalamin biosynthesis Mg chelatase CobN
MKNLKQISLISIVAISIFTSCTVQKRLYRPGFFVESNSNYKNDKSVNSEKNKTKVVVEDEKFVAETESKSITDSKNIETANNSSNVQNVKNDNSVYTNDYASVDNKPEISVQKQKIYTSSSIDKSNANDENKSSKIAQVKNQKNKNTSSSSSSGTFSGGMLVLMIILCLFPLINLIPVYLHDGSVTLNFWITLVLDLIVIGGIIFSLLVVLDVVSLA